MMISLQEFEASDRFFSTLYEAVDQSHRHKHPIWHGRGPRPSAAAIIRQFDESLSRRMVHAEKRENRKTGQRLKQSDFKQIVHLIQGASEVRTIEQLRLEYNAYQTIARSLSAKQNPHRAIGYIETAKINSEFAKHCRPEWLLSDNLVTDDDTFNDFLTQAIGSPAANDRQGNALTAAYLACQHLKSERDQRFYKASSDQYAQRLLYLSRKGAWIAQQNGQWWYFDWFKKTASDCQSISPTPFARVVNHMMDFHSNRRQRDRISSGNNAKLAYKIVTEGENIRTRYKLMPGELYILQNALVELRVEGFGLKDKLPSLGGITISDMVNQMRGALQESEKNHPISNHVDSLLIQARFHVSANNFGVATPLITEALSLSHPTRRKADKVSYLLSLIAMGECELKQTGPRENVHLMNALTLAVDMGAVHRARRISCMMKLG